MNVTNGTNGCSSAQSAGVEVFGWIGCITAWFLFVAPIPTMRKIVRMKTTEKFSSVPYFVSMLQCGLWTVYATVTPCKLQPFVTNVVGCLLEALYVLIFVWYAPSRTVRTRMMLATLAVVLIFVGLTLFALLLGPALPIAPWPEKHASKQTTLLGFICIGLNIAMYASPLEAIRIVTRTRSVESMPLLLTIGCGLCSGCWFAYALLVGDDFILVPNAAGLGLAVLQLIVYRCFAPFIGARASTSNEPGSRSPKSSVRPSNRGVGTPRESLLFGVSDVPPVVAQAHVAGLTSPVADPEAGAQ